MTKLLALILALCACVHAATVPNRKLALPDVEGIVRMPFDLKPGHFSMLIYLLQDCPISNHYAKEIQRICADYLTRNLHCYLVYVDPTASAADLRKHVKEYGYTAFPAIPDLRHNLVTATKPENTPEAALVNSAGDVLYVGRIDDSYETLGTVRSQPTQRNVREALDAALSGKPVPNPRTKAVGCSIAPLDIYLKGQ